MDKPTNSLCKDPGELSHQEQRVLMHQLERRFQGRQFMSKEEGESAVRAAIGEYLGCSPQAESNVVWVLWCGLLVVLLAGVWMYRYRRQGFVG